MNKHNLFAVLAVLMLLAAPAHAQTLEQQAVKNIEDHISQKCTGKDLSPALCECEMGNAKSTQFTLFVKSIKTQADWPKLDEYYVQNIVVPCVLNRSVAQKLCTHSIKQKNTEHSESFINDYCECTAEEMGENLSRSSLAGLDRFQIMVRLSEENQRAYTKCNTQRKD